MSGVEPLASELQSGIIPQPTHDPGARTNKHGWKRTHLTAGHLWALSHIGFYVLDATSHGKSLILGPFMGQVACQTIDFGRGVCGTAAATKQTQLVPDVDAFPGHIACDGASKSEIVVPVTVEVVSPEEGGHVEKKVVGISELIMTFIL